MCYIDEVYAYLYASMQGLRNVGCNSAADAAYSPDTLTFLANRLTAMALRWEEGDRVGVIKDYPVKLTQIYEILKG